MPMSSIKEILYQKTGVTRHKAYFSFSERPQKPHSTTIHASVLNMTVFLGFQRQLDMVGYWEDNLCSSGSITLIGTCPFSSHIMI